MRFSQRVIDDAPGLPELGRRCSPSPTQCDGDKAGVIELLAPWQDRVQFIRALTALLTPNRLIRSLEERLGLAPKQLLRSAEILGISAWGGWGSPGCAAQSLTSRSA
jgi:hypothetical protein